MEAKNKFKIFKNGSRTYFYSSLFFPKKIRTEIAILYAFVRTADNFVDNIPQNKKGFNAFCDKFENSWRGTLSNNPIVDDFVNLAKERSIKKEWIDSFLEAMKSDLSLDIIHNKISVLEYIYGSAEVIGLMMARLMDLPEKSYYGAQLLGRSMQYINFIRDINEDLSLGRQYLPLESSAFSDLKKIDYQIASSRPQEFTSFIKSQLNLYESWQKEAEKYFTFIPKRYLLPISIASSMYNYTAKQISKNPMLIFRKKIKPSKLRIILAGSYKALKILW